MSRRHRIHEFEVEPTKRALEIYLTRLLEEREDEPEAVLAFRLLFRLHRHQIGNPGYPDPVTWSSISSWLASYGTISPREMDAYDILTQLVAYFLSSVNKSRDPAVFNELLAFTQERWPELESKDRVNVSVQALKVLLEKVDR